MQNNFSVTAGNRFDNWDFSTINADNFSVTAGDDFDNRSYSTINADNFNVTAGRDFDNQRKATISADNFNVTAGDLFSNYDSATINTDNFNVTAGDRFSNYDSATINANNLTISADFFTNTDRYGDGSITADTFSLSVAGDFDYANDFGNNGNIDATNQNFIARNGNLINNISIALVGNLGITADNYTQIGVIDIAGDLSIQVTS